MSEADIGRALEKKLFNYHDFGVMVADIWGIEDDPVKLKAMINNILKNYSSPTSTKPCGGISIYNEPRNIPH